MDPLHKDLENTCSQSSDTIQNLRNIAMQEAADDTLKFIIQHFLPLPDDLTTCPHRRMQITSMESIRYSGSKSSWYTFLPCGSAEEWLSLPYQRYNSQHITVPPSILYSPDIDYLRCNKKLLVRARWDPQKNYSEHSNYCHVFCMRQFPGTHEGYVLLELISSSTKPDQPCNCCDRKDCVFELLSFELKDRTMYCLRSYVRDNTGTSDGKAVGPAFKRSTEVEKGLFMEIDIVEAIFCPDWPPMADEWRTRQRQSNWPPASTLEQICNGGSYVVPVGYKNSLLPDYEWRVSFSQAEVLLARSLNDVQRKSFMIVKTWLQTSLKDPEILSSYHIKTLLFWRCESLSPEMWTESNMADHVLGLLETLIYCLGKKTLPHYFMSQHNLFDHINDEDGELIKSKAGLIKDSLKQHLLESFVSLMPCCVTGKTLVCIKDIYTCLLEDIEKSQTLQIKTKQKFLQQIARYYLLLKRYDLYTEKLFHCLKLSNEDLAIDSDSFFKSLSDTVMATADVFIAQDYMIWYMSKFHSSYSEKTRINVHNEQIKLYYTIFVLRNLQKTPVTEYIEHIKNTFLRIGERAPENAQTSAYLAFVLYQLDFIDLSLQKVHQGFQLLSQCCFQIKDEGQSYLVLTKNSSVNQESICTSESKPKANFKCYFKDFSDPTPKSRTEQTKTDLFPVSNNSTATNVEDKAEQTKSDLFPVSDNSTATNVKDKTEQTKSDLFPVSDNSTATNVEDIAEQTKSDLFPVSDNSKSTNVEDKAEQTKSEPFSISDNSSSTDVVDKAEQTKTELFSVSDNSTATFVEDKAEQTESDRFSVSSYTKSSNVNDKKNELYAFSSQKVVIYKLEKEFMDDILQKASGKYLSSHREVYLPVDFLLLYTKMKCLIAQENYEAVSEIQTSIQSLSEYSGISSEERDMITIVNDQVKQQLSLM